MNSTPGDYHLFVQSLFLEIKGGSRTQYPYFLEKKNITFYIILFFACLYVYFCGVSSTGRIRVCTDFFFFFRTGLLCIIPRVTINSSVALVNSLIIVLLLAIRFLPLNQLNPKFSIVYNLILVFSLAVTILPFFLAVSDAVTYTNRKLVDAQLLSIDRFLLGWYVCGGTVCTAKATPHFLGGGGRVFFAAKLNLLFFDRLYPEGQLSLALDSSKYFNTSTTIGKYYVEIFVLCYLSYYFWGYAALIILVRRYVVSWRARRSVDTTISLAYIRFPRLYLKDKYKYPLGGTAVTRFLVRITSDNMSFGSFPSGHVAETLVVGIFTSRLNRTLGILIMTFALLIMLSTQVLRYHYFVDILGALVVSVISTQFASCLRHAQFTEQVHSLASAFMLRSITGLNNNNEYTFEGGQETALGSINHLVEEIECLDVIQMEGDGECDFVNDVVSNRVRDGSKENIGRAAAIIF
ncbi:PA-phosphatase related-family protein DDB_G0268928-like isoform X2 [Schistocerca gregaria]|uniref:PA-phosphatase related-family protein DDB_G0268928-like isoform X2 n=1 Tax=Schistocerca gregaria TaxID=7010 RepID=UPI00211E9328|nr:PA-phosphatase related-family protein DDB_G0268928-like isoform X2 [Schistocerca gregaria]